MTGITPSEYRKGTKYKIRFSKVVNGKTVKHASTKKDALKMIRSVLYRFPYIRASMEVRNKNDSGYHPIGTYEFVKKGIRRVW